MPAPIPDDEMSMRLAADLDAGTAAAAHARLLALLDAVEAGEAATLELEPADGGASPLSMQLLVSARRSFPPGRLSLGARAAAALATLEQSKEI